MSIKIINSFKHDNKNKTKIIDSGKRNKHNTGKIKTTKNILMFTKDNITIKLAQITKDDYYFSSLTSVKQIFKSFQNKMSLKIDNIQ